jgi:hypothetical protein
MIRVLRVARRGAMKARVAAAEQLYGVLSPPKSLGPDAHTAPGVSQVRSGLLVVGQARPGELLD